jgi:hypothetical protein
MNIKFRIMCVVMVALGTQACFAVGTPWADAVVSFDQPEGSSSLSGPASNALGAPDGQSVSIFFPEILILGFTDNRVYNGSGDDVFITETSNGVASVAIYGRAADGPCTYLTTLTGSGGINLGDHPGLNYLDFIRFVGEVDSDLCPGFNLDSVEAINSVGLDDTLDSNGSACIPAPGAVILCMIGTSLVGLVRRYT